MNRTQRTLGTLIAAMIPAPLAAHPGHGAAGPFGGDFAHWITSPEHVVVLAALVVGAVALQIGVRRLTVRPRPHGVRRR